MKKIFAILSTGMILVLAGCQNSPAGKTPDTATLGMANPASVHCIEKGGRLEMRTNAKGEYGVCLFEDNRQCEEWAFFRGECPEGGVKITGYENDAQIFCAITGGKVEGVGTKTPMCKRIDGTYCNAQANLDGDCPDPHDPNPSAGNRVVEEEDQENVVEKADITEQDMKDLKVVLEKEQPAYVASAKPNYTIEIIKRNGKHISATLYKDGAFMPGFPGFYAYLSGSGWKILFSGQEVPECGKADALGFPSDIVPDCWSATGQVRR